MRHPVLLLLALCLSSLAWADEAGTAQAFQKLRSSPWLLRQFMAEFPGGGDLHNHLDGSIYAENIIQWAAEDGKCVAPVTGQISFPPCDASRPAMKDHAADSVNYRQLVDAYSVRNYTEQMTVIGALGKLYPDVKVSLHAGEFGFGLVPPEDFRDHIRQALAIAGARRIGHGEAIGLETGALDTLRDMARRGIAVEINLTSNAIVHDLKGEQHPFLLYRRFGVPTALSADDEGVFRIDLTHEYQRAAATYPSLTYRDFKQLSRNALHYGFVEGQALLADTASGRFVAACAGERAGREAKAPRCRDFLGANTKARLQWDLEARFASFEARPH